MVWDGYNFCSASVRAGPVPEVHQWHTLGEAEVFETQKMPRFFLKKTVVLGDGNSNIFLMFIPIWGRWTHFDDHIFQMGWFNHQLDLGCIPKILAKKTGRKRPPSLNWWHRARNFPSSAPTYQPYTGNIPSPKFHDIIYIYIQLPPPPRSTYKYYIAMLESHQLFTKYFFYVFVFP